MKFILCFSAVLAALLALLGPSSLVKASRGASPVAMASAVLLSLAASGLFPSISAAPVPVPDVATFAIAAVVDGLPSCAKPVMNSMVTRAADFGCAPAADGQPDVVCLCQNRPFKKEAKHSVHEACPNGANIGAAREWAINSCTAALATAARFIAATSAEDSVPNNSETKFGTPADNAVSKSSSSSSTVAPQVAVFELDDDEDETARAGVLRPGLGMTLVWVLFVASLLVNPG